MDNKLDTIGGRAKYARQQTHLRQLDLALEIHVSESTIANLECNRTSKPDTIRKVAKATGVEYAWILTGDKSMAPSHDLLRISNAKLTAERSVGIEITEQKHDVLIMPKKWFCKHIHADYTQHYIAAFAQGDTMSPTIHDGDIIVINKIDKNLNDGVWVLKINNTIYARRIQLSANNEAITLISDNQSYSPQEIIKADSDIEVIGKITNVMHMTSL